MRQARPLGRRKRRPSHAGSTLLEIFKSLSIITTVIVAFANVFPFGARLNATNAAENQALATANSIVEELRKLPLTTLEAMVPVNQSEGNPNPQDLVNQSRLRTEVAVGVPTDSQRFYIPANGISIIRRGTTRSTITPPPFGEVPPGDTIGPDIRAVQISIVVQWNETRGQQVKIRRVYALGYVSNTVAPSVL